MLIKQISIFIENKAGRLAEITAMLAAEGVDIRALSISDTTDFGILRLIVNDPPKAEKLLRDKGMTFSVTNVIAVGLPDRPGGLAEVMQALAGAGVSVEYMYAFLTPQQRRRACIIMRVEDTEKTLQVLRQARVETLSEQEVYSL